MTITKNDKTKNNFRSYFKANGFSLIEVLIAVGILAAAVTTIMGHVENAHRVSANDEDRLQLVYLANNKMVEIEQKIDQDVDRGVRLDESTESGQFEDPFNHVKWTYEIKAIQIPVINLGGESSAQNFQQVFAKKISEGLREIDLTVYTGKNDKDPDYREFKITTHVVTLK